MLIRMLVFMCVEGGREIAFIDYIAYITMDDLSRTDFDLFYSEHFVNEKKATSKLWRPKYANSTN